MTRDEIIELARQLKMPYYYQDNTIKDLKKLEAFAKRVAEKKRTWAGLTDAEQSFVFDQVKQIVDSKPFWVRFADSIEAKLKEKNNG